MSKPNIDESLNNTRFPKLNLPQPNLEIVEENLVLKVRCLARQKYVVLTPEEWVRQHLVHYLVVYKFYPLSRIGLEFQLKYGKTNRRADLLVIDKNRKPQIIVECKAPQVDIKQGVMDQVAKYNTVIGSGIVVISNGIRHFVVQVEEGGEGLYLKDIPENKLSN